MIDKYRLEESDGNSWEKAKGEVNLMFDQMVKEGNVGSARSS
jgi:hypothetical protein